MLEGKNGVIGKWHQLFKSGSNFFKSGELSGDNFLGASETPVYHFLEISQSAGNGQTFKTDLWFHKNDHP